MKFLHTWLLLCLISLTLAQTTQAQCPTSIPGFTSLGEYDGNQYYLSTQNAKWLDARDIAQANGGYLVSINSEEENNFILSNINEITFIGLSDEVTNNAFKWESGEPFSFDNYVGQNFFSKKYGNMNFWNGEWSLDGKYTARKYIIEIDCDNSQPTGLIVDCQNNYEMMVATAIQANTRIEYAAILNASTNCSNGINDIAYYSLLPEYPDGVSLPPGEYDLSVEMVDRCGNNTICDFTLTINPFSTILFGTVIYGLPELSVQNAYFEGSFFPNFNAGNPELMTVNLRNEGGLIETPVTWSLYLSETDMLTSNAILLDQFVVERMSYGSLKRYFDFDIPENLMPNNEYYFIIRADDTDVINEPDETNNIRVLNPFTISEKQTFDNFCAFESVSTISSIGEFERYSLIENNEGIKILSVIKGDENGVPTYYFENEFFNGQGDTQFKSLYDSPQPGIYEFASGYITDVYSPTRFTFEVLGSFLSKVRGANIALTAGDADAEELMSFELYEINDHLLLTGVYRTTTNTFRPFILKTDLLGNRIWQQVYEPVDIDLEFVFQSEAQEGGYYFTAQAKDNSASFLQRFDEQGEQLWSQLIAEDLSNNTITYGGETSDGASVVFGVGSPNNGLAELSGLNPNTGDEIWMTELATAFSNSSIAFGKSIEGIILSEDGGIIVSASIQDGNNTFSKYGKLDTNGNVIWNYDFPSGKENAIPQVITSDGGILFGKYDAANSSISAFYVNEAGLFAPDCNNVPTPCEVDYDGFQSLGEYGGSYFFLSDEPKTHQAAQLFSYSRSGYLAVIQNQEKNDFLQAQIDEQVLIGINDKANEGELKWTNNSTPGFLNFDNGCSFCQTNTAENDFVVMHQWNGKWSFNYQNNPRRFIMEIPCSYLLSAPQTSNEVEAGKTKTLINPQQSNYTAFEIFPNPAMDEVFAMITSDVEQRLDLQLFNANGQRLKIIPSYIIEGNNTITIPIGELPNGIYTIYIPQLETKQKAIRFVKSK